MICNHLHKDCSETEYSIINYLSSQATKIANKTTKVSLMVVLLSILLSVLQNMKYNIINLWINQTLIFHLKKHQL